MILELKDEEILDFLMTSDFEEDYKPEELKYLLVKFRYFYRILNGKQEITFSNLESALQRIDELNSQRDSAMDQLRIENAQKSDLIDQLKGKKLTWKERFSGKIITNNED